MNTAVCKASHTGSWRDVYQAAILEPDLNKLSERIVEAETALAVRAQELFCATVDDTQEGESVDDAMCILHVLRGSLKHHETTVIQRTSDFDHLKRT
jgi:hypothetical protein